MPPTTWLHSPPRMVLYVQIQQKNVPAQFPESYGSNLPFDPHRHVPVPGKLYEHRIPATTPRVTKTLKANQPSFTAGSMCPPRDFSPLASLRASRSMPSPTTSPVKTLNKTASPSPSATRPSLGTSPVPTTDYRASSSSGTGSIRGLRPDSPLHTRAFRAAPHGPPPPPMLPGTRLG